MTAIMRTVGVAAVLAVSTIVGAAGAVSGADNNNTFKPLAGVSLHLGSKHAIGYFVKGKDVCQLTLVVGEEPVGDEIPAVTPTRFSAAIEAGRSAHFDTGGGTQQQFSCAPRATAMTVKALDQVAYTAPRK